MVNKETKNAHTETAAAAQDATTGSRYVSQKATSESCDSRMYSRFHRYAIVLYALIRSPSVQIVRFPDRSHRAEWFTLRPRRKRQENQLSTQSATRKTMNKTIVG